MAFLKVGDGKVTNRRNTKKSKKKTYSRKAQGIVYLIKLKLDCGKTIFKIGITTRRSINDRLLENVLAHFMTYRYIPRTSVKKFSKTEYYTEVEAYLHRVFKDRQHKFDKPFGGSTEYFEVPEDELIEMYEKVMADPTRYIEPTRATLNKQVVMAQTEEVVSVNDMFIGDIDVSVDS